MLSEQSIEKYQKIYRKQYDIDISKEDAAEQATRFLSIARIVFQPMPKRFLQRYNELLKEQQELEAQEKP